MVSDDAMHKLQAFQQEHKNLLEKTQYLLDNSQLRNRSDSRESGENSFFTQQKQDRNRFFAPQVKSYETEQIRQDPAAVRQFHQEYQDVLVMGKNMAGEIYLVDIMERLHFLYHDVTLKEKNR